MKEGLLRIIAYTVIILIPVAVAALRHGTSEGVIYQTGRNFALLGFMILALQVWLAARIKWIKRSFGLDILIRYHKHMAVFAVCLLVLHPLLLAADGIKMKMLAAHRAGLTTVIIPKRNEKDLDDLPDEVRNTMLFVAVERIDEALDVALCSVENADDDLPVNAEL